MFRARTNLLSLGVPRTYRTAQTPATLSPGRGRINKRHLSGPGPSPFMVMSNNLSARLELSDIELSAVSLPQVQRHDALDNVAIGARGRGGAAGRIVLAGLLDDNIGRRGSNAVDNEASGATARQSPIEKLAVDQVLSHQLGCR